MQRFLFPAILILGLGLPACRVEPVEDTDVVVTVPPEFIVDLYEQRDATDGRPTFGLWVETVKNDYPAANYRLETNVTVTGSAIVVQLLEVVAPDQPAGSPGPARGFVAVGNLPEGTYDFSISLAGTLMNRGRLQASGDRFELVLTEPEAGIDLQNRVLMRLPDATVWGYALTPTEIQMPAANAFLLNLKSLTAEPGLPPGFYGYFTVSGTGQVFFHRSIEPAVAAQYFVRQRTASPDELRGLLEGYRNDAQTPLQIRCWTTEGEL